MLGHVTFPKLLFPAMIALKYGNIFNYFHYYKVCIR